MLNGVIILNGENQGVVRRPGAAAAEGETHHLSAPEYTLPARDVTLKLDFCPRRLVMRWNTCVIQVNKHYN